MRFVPARRLYLLLALGASILAVAPAAGIAVDAAALLLAAADLLVARKRGVPDAAVSAPDRISMDEEREASVAIENRAGGRATLRFVLDVPDALAGPGANDVRALVLAPGERASAAVPLVGRARGEHRLGALHQQRLGPLGLVWVRGRRASDRAVLVVPGLRELRARRLLAARPQEHLPGLRETRRRGDGGAFESLRGYERGDDPRHLDWKASARRGALIVRQYEAERSQSVVLCIDTGRLMVERIGGRSRLDRALASALVLAEVARARHDLVGVFAFSDQVHAVLTPGRWSSSLLAETFARMESRAVEPDYPRALGRLSRLVRRRSLLVFFSDVIDDEVSGSLASNLARLARRHLPLFVAMRNADLFGIAEAPAADAERALRRAAATELLLARARTLARMREQGIRVADVAPEAAVADVVNRYLEIKRRGAL